MFMPKLNAAGTTWLQNGWDPTVSNNSPARYSSAEVANASAVATLPAVTGQTGFITGAEVYVGGATAGALVDLSITGLLGGTQVFPVSAPAGVALAGSPLILKFAPPIPASAVNTAIVATLPALGVGNVKALVVLIGGYQ